MMTSRLKLLATVMALMLAVPLSAAHAQEDPVTELLLRVEAMEGQMRQLNGQVEQLQFLNQRLEEQLKKNQADTDFRLQDLEKAGANKAPAAPGSSKRSESESTGGASAAPSGNAAPSPAGSGLGAPPQNLGALIAQTNGSGSGSTSSAAAPAAAATPRDVYDQAYATLQRGDNASAEREFRGFLAQNAGNKLVPDALFWLGESQARQRKHKEAGETFLKVIRDHAGATRAPNAMVGLGRSLGALKEKEAACATLASVPQKYPKASDGVKRQAEQEAKLLKC
jgi:tol-pal system protein YbgF